jgi:hypothetical protein
MMGNSIVIDIDLLENQLDAIGESELPEDIKEGLSNMFGTIIDMADDYDIRRKGHKNIEFVAKIDG